jgi:RecB family endonuclease NucS
MYKIDDSDNSISKVEIKKFSDMGYKERQHLQEWIAKNPEVFGEELLIIHKEFSGFSDTKERLDLLALDKQGNLVVIENKLDDSGKDVIWQILKYASYCSSLTKSNIRDIYQDYLKKGGKEETAEESLNEFFNVEDLDELKLNVGNTQRIIMVAAKFRKEITSTVLWLINYRLRIQCFKVTPYQTEKEKYIHFEQIIPVKDIEEYMISMADKAQSDIAVQEEEKARHRIRLEFWKHLIKKANDTFDLYQNVNPSKENWISGGTGISGASFNCVIAMSHTRVEVYISRSNKDENKFIFDELKKLQDQIEDTFGSKLIWQRLDDKKASRIKYELSGVNYFNEEDWPKIITFLVESMHRMTKAFKAPLKEVRMKLLEFLRKDDD